MNFLDFLGSISCDISHYFSLEAKKLDSDLSGG